MNPEMTRLRHEAPDEFARQFIEDVLAHDRGEKIEVAPDELPNRVIYIPAHVDEVLMIMPMSLDDRGVLPAMEIDICCNIARKEKGGPFFIAFCAEVYIQLPTEEPFPKVRGEITKRYMRGDSGTSEALSMIAYHRRLDGSLRMLSVNLPFCYCEGEVTFSEPLWVDSIDDGMPDGAIPQAMVAAFGSEQN